MTPVSMYKIGRVLLLCQTESRMELLTDVELVQTLNLQAVGEPLNGIYHTVQKYTIAGRLVHTLREGRLIRERDIVGKNPRSQQYLAQWVKVSEELLKICLRGRITTGEYTEWINGGHGDPNEALAGATGRYITILMYAAWRTVGTRSTMECTTLTGEEGEQWRRLLLNTPIVGPGCEGMLILPGIQFTLKDLATKAPTTQHQLASGHVNKIKAIVFERDGVTRNCAKSRKEADEAEVVERERLANLAKETRENALVEAERIRQEEDAELEKINIQKEQSRLAVEEKTRHLIVQEMDVLSQLRSCPPDIRVLFAEQKTELKESLRTISSLEGRLADGNHKIIKLENQIQELHARIERLTESHREDLKSLAERRITLTVPDEKGLLGEMRVRDHLEAACCGRFRIVSVRTTHDHMDLHVKISDTKIVAVEVKTWKDPVDREGIDKFMNNIITLTQKPGLSVVGAFLISLTSRISGHSSPDIWSQMCQKTGIKTWMVNNLESAINPVAVLAQIFVDLAEQEWLIARGIQIGMGVQRGEPVEKLLKTDNEELYSLLCDAIPRSLLPYPSSYQLIQGSPGSKVSEIKSEDENISARAAIAEGRVATETVSTPEGVMVRSLIDSTTHEARAEILAANGDGGSLVRDGITGALVASSYDANSGRTVERVMVGSKLIECKDGVALPRDIPVEYHEIFDVSKPWGTGLHDIALAIIRLCDVDKSSYIRLGKLRKMITENTNGAIPEATARLHINLLIRTCICTRDATDSRKTLIRGLRPRKPETIPS